MSRIPWISHCVGRLLIDLPSDAELHYTTTLWNQRLQREGDTVESMHAEAERFAAEVAALRHDTHGRRLIRRVGLPNAGVAIYYFSTAVDSLAAAKIWLVSTNKWMVFSWHSPSDLDPKRIDSEAIPFVCKLSELLRERPSQHRLSVPGICVDNGGFIAGRDWLGERFTADASFAAHPGISFGLDSWVYDSVMPEDSLLKRVNTATAIYSQVAGLRTLRQRKRKVGEMAGEEALFIATVNGQLRPVFKWETPGIARSLQFPFLSADMNFWDEHITTSPFASDNEAVELWDAILRSIRLRPGAV